MGPGTPIGHDNNAVCHCLVVLRKNAHHEDGHIGPTNASTLSQGRRGGEFLRRNKHCLMFICEHLGALDVLTSGLVLSNNKLYCFRIKGVKGGENIYRTFLRPTGGRSIPPSTIPQGIASSSSSWYRAEPGRRNRLFCQRQC